MRVLVVKLSSLGDVIHTLPALTDAAAALPDVSFDWIVEEAFAEIPAWHSACERVIPVALRRWRHQPLRALYGAQWARVRRSIRARDYDLVLDAQGLLKSAAFAGLAFGPRVGMDRHSARESLAALAYQRTVAVPREQHAVARLRLLFARSLGYEPPSSPPDYGLQSFAAGRPAGVGVAFIHGSTRRDKLWPTRHWRELAALVVGAGHSVGIPSGNPQERERAQQIAAGNEDRWVHVWPGTSLSGLAQRLQGMGAAVAVDTGPGHLAAALGVPGVALYGPTQPARVGTLAAGQRHLCAANGALDAIAPADVWQVLEPLLSASRVVSIDSPGAASD